MSADSRPPDIDTSNADITTEVGPDREDLLSGTRTPRPYHHEANEIQQDRGHGSRDTFQERNSLKDAETLRNQRQYRKDDSQSGEVSPTSSESGTEADDERPNYVKALPAPHLRPRKGLKTGELNEDTLLTPSQLDDEGRRLSQEYFGYQPKKDETSAENQKEGQDKFLRRRLAEFARRSSEVALTIVIALTVLYGAGVFAKARQWRWELASYVFIIVSLILAYPVKLSIVDSQSQARKLWQRFRVPASFDPATVLYPPFLPVLVALLVSPANPAAVLPNVVLGLCSLPQRLFPRSSRLGGFNSLHWLVSIVPVIISENVLWPAQDCHREPYLLKCPPSAGLTPETLVSLYPLHHALLVPLHYLTTTSLLMSELHLLSVSITNLLLLARSPQMVILKAVLWIGGVTFFVALVAVLHWNVALMRVPRWKLRRPGHTAEERKSLVDAVSDLMSIQRATAAFATNTVEESDADEDEPSSSMTAQPPTTNLKLTVSNLGVPSADQAGPKSAIEPSSLANGAVPASGLRQRSNTLPVRDPPSVSEKQPSRSKSRKSSSLSWYLHLTADQARRRKWIYAFWTYFVIATVVLIPVRYYIQTRAVHGYEPIGWAISYLGGQLETVWEILHPLHLNPWVPPSPPVSDWRKITLTFPLNFPANRLIIGAANVRLLLILYWATVLCAGLLAVFSLTSLVEVDTRRKVFHGVMVAMMLPATFVDPCACALALTFILAVFLALEVIRAGQVQPLGNAIGRFVAPYVDGRDLRGPVVVSHLFLLIGCAVPMWFSLASIERDGEPPWQGWELEDDKREVAMVAGIICVGMGDAAASLIGRRYGRHKWIWVGGKSLEGSAAFVAAVTIGLIAAKAWLAVGGWSDNNGSIDGHLGRLGGSKCVVAWAVTLIKAVFCACGASFMEAVLTGANDNVVVPVALWLMVKGARV